MVREAGTIRERLYQALIKRYTADQEDALVKIDSLMLNHMVIPPGMYSGPISSRV